MAAHPDLLALGERYHQAGDLPRAAQVYRQVLQAEPENAHAWHLLGLACRALGKVDEGVASLRQALRCRPGDADVHNNLGAALASRNQLDEAVAHFREAVRLRPHYAAAYGNLGNALEAQGKPDEAVANYRQAVRLDPNLWGVHRSLGKVLQRQGRLDEAVASFRQALRCRPGDADVQNNLGAALASRNQLDEAAAHFREAVRLRPHDAAAHGNLGNALQAQGKPDEAVRSYQEAVRLDPGFAAAYSSLGNLFRKVGRLDEAMACFRQALHCRPDDAVAHNDLGALLATQNQLDEAVAHCREALRLQPHYAGAHNNLGMALMAGGGLEEALAAFRQTLRLEPANWAAHSNLLFCLSHTPGPSPDSVFAEYIRWGELHGNLPAPPPYDNDPSPERRLRIGYVSPDLRAHAVARFFEPILTHHDPARVETICYAEVARPDAVTARLRALAGGWRSTCGLSDAQVAEQVRADRIDVLVDLAGHTANHRLRVFARKPAPVQATYLGHPATTGLRAIDYRLTDAVIEPPDEPGFSTEEVVRLSCGRYCFAPPEEAPEVAPPPVQRTGRITFGSFHRLSKLNAGVLDLWCQVLRALPSARLIVLRDTLAGHTRAELLRQFLERGVGAEQLDLRHAAEARGYLKVFAEVDVFLDTFPFTGATIACESLWMGVPFATLRGDRPTGRLGATLLTRVGLAELIAATREELLARTVELARDVPRLAVLRTDLRRRMRATLCDGAAFTRSLEDVYREMWRRWCARPQVPH